MTRPLAPIIDLEAHRSALLARRPPIVFGSVELDGDRVRLLADCRLTASSAELLAHELYRLAGMLREGERDG